jgi:hypothetical protein
VSYVTTPMMSICPRIVRCAGVVNRYHFLDAFLLQKSVSHGRALEGDKAGKRTGLAILLSYSDRFSILHYYKLSLVNVVNVEYTPRTHNGVLPKLTYRS